MIIFSVIITWIINSFKWFSYFCGASLLCYLFSKDKSKIDTSINAHTIIQILLLAQPIAVAYTFSQLGVEGKFPLYISCLFGIPFVIYYYICSKKSK